MKSLTHQVRCAKESEGGGGAEGHSEKGPIRTETARSRDGEFRETSRQWERPAPIPAQSGRAVRARERGGRCVARAAHLSPLRGSERDKALDGVRACGERVRGTCGLGGPGEVGGGARAQGPPPAAVKRAGAVGSPGARSGSGLRAPREGRGDPAAGV